jgi:thioredoxin-like negative regulator of GroEL
MKLLKSAVVATTLALSLGSFSTTADVCLGMACMYNRMTPMEGIEATIGQITKAMIGIHANAGDEAVIDDIKEALKLSKEINANDKLDRNRNRANDSLKKARAAVQSGDSVKATEELKEAEKRFSDLKGMIDLTQADRVSQQTNLLNRIMDTPDTAAGARK